MVRRILALAMFLGFATGASADVVDISPAGFFVRHEVTVNAAPDKIYNALTGQIGAWWNPEHTYSNDSKNLTIDARPGGCLCETLPNGGGVAHMTVVNVSRGQLIRMGGALGPLQASGIAGSMTWKLSPDPSSTKVELSYSVGGYMQGGFGNIAPAVNGVLGEQLNRLKTFVETGKPTARVPGGA
jgi:uncharacterized protein YndB with AHSA1/START domain